MRGMQLTAGARSARQRLAAAVLALLSFATAARANTPAAAAADAPGRAQQVTQWVTLEAPVEDGRVTSPYGWRIHPILKRRRFHRGVDFGAPEGTPVHAAEDGVIEAIGRRGHYGLYLRIRHCATVETSYAHLSSFAPGLRPGSAVSRGQVIAEVGRTGWATGPHLFYEVIVDGHPVNPDQPDLEVPMSRPAGPATNVPQQAAIGATS
jgi:murein DD-endopeptidase MepM/ murein hydrolase activator NlpD